MPEHTDSNLERALCEVSNEIGGNHTGVVREVVFTCSLYCKVLQYYGMKHPFGLVRVNNELDTAAFVVIYEDGSRRAFRVNGVVLEDFIPGQVSKPLCGYVEKLDKDTELSLFSGEAFPVRWQEEVGPGVSVERLPDGRFRVDIDTDVAPEGDPDHIAENEHGPMIKICLNDEPLWNVL